MKSNFSILIKRERNYYSQSRGKVKDRDFAQFFRKKIPSEIELPLTALVSRGVKSSGDMYITSLNPNTFSLSEMNNAYSQALFDKLQDISA